MSKKLTKDDLKKDVMTEELQKGFIWTTQHVMGVSIFLVAFIILGSGYSVYTYFDSKKEEALQEGYYQVEKEYLAQKAKFDAFEADAAKAIDALKDKKKDAAKKAPTAVESKGVKASGDLTQDYGKVVSDFDAVITKNPSSNAAMMAGLSLADIYSSYQQADKAMVHLEKVKPGNNLLGALLLDRKAGLKADLGDCKSAVGVWDQVLAIKASKFMAAEVKLKKGLCFEAMNDPAQAQAMYTQAKEGDAQSPISKTAEKYLHTLSVSKPAAELTK